MSGSAKLRGHLSDMLSPPEQKTNKIKRGAVHLLRPIEFLGLICILLLIVTFMVRPLIGGEALTEPQTAAASSKEPITFPSTPAGRQFAQWLQAFNTGDANEIRGFISKHFEPIALKRISLEERVVMDLVVHNVTRGLVPYHIDWSTDPEITVLARSNLTEDSARIHLEVGSDQLHRIKILTLALMGNPADTNALDKLTDAQIPERLEVYMKRLAAADIFSGAVVVARNGKPVFQKSYGLADEKSHLANQVDTRFNIGSMDKMFTAVAIAQLAQVGKLSFDDTIGKHLPGYPNKTAAEKVTIHQLLTHTSGMGDYNLSRSEEGEEGEGGDGEKENPSSVKDVLSQFASNHLSSAPGEKWFYSNAGYIVLGAIVESVSGQSYFDYVTEHIFKPAGMSNTDFYQTGKDTSKVAMGYTNSGLGGTLEYLSRTDNTSIPSARPGPAGGGFSTVEDLQKFDVALRTHKLLNPKFTDLVLAGKIERDDESGGKYTYGFAEDMVNGKRIVGYTAGFPGGNGTFDMYVDSEYTVAVLSNYDPPSAQRVAYRLREMITRKRQ
jgi:CubicO group peptidase (beta-lactamase class C family)